MAEILNVEIAQRDPMKGRRIVRGREPECETH